MGSYLCSMLVGIAVGSALDPTPKGLALSFLCGNIGAALGLLIIKAIKL